MNRIESSEYLSITFDLSRPSAFIFDLDGTLVKSTQWHLEAYNQVVKNNGINNEIKESDIKGLGTEEVFRSLGIIDDNKLKKLTEEKRSTYMGYIKSNRIEPYPYARELLKLLSENGRTLILVSSASKNIVNETLESVKLKQYFENRIVTREQTNLGKPSPEPFLYALRRMQVKPRETVTIEDAEIGIEGSIKAGVVGILVNNEIAPPGIPTFESIKILYEMVKKHIEINNSFKAPSKNYPFEWDTIIGEEPPNYNRQSDHELFSLLEQAADKEEAEVNLLRIGAPLYFRRQIIALLEDSIEFESLKAAEALKNRRIKSIKFLLADPYGVEFLRRLDYERAGSWGIWRIRNEVLLFIKGIFRLFEKRGQPDNFKIGIHNGALLWNVGILMSKDTDKDTSDKVKTVKTVNTVLLRIYGKGTGHDDSKKSEWLTVGDALAKLAITYWEYISSEAEEGTMWITDDEPFKPDKHFWPSLYKGNAILSCERDFDNEDYDSRVEKDVIWKICKNENEHNAELKLLKVKEIQEFSKYFRPVKLHPNKSVCFGRTPMSIERIPGASLFEIQCAVNGIVTSKSEGYTEAPILLEQLLVDSTLALRDFRKIALEKLTFIEYAYDEQLVKALGEVKSYISISKYKGWDEVIEEAMQLGRYLKSKAKVPFRDAHSKNRLWSTKEKPIEIAHRLLKQDIESRKEEMQNSLKDIDFETSAYKVTEWDDVIHVLFFEKSGVNPFCTEDPIKLIVDRWGPVADKKLLWSTVLARSIRELCRRIWYARVMPNNYLERYGLENRDYFLKLARLAFDRYFKSWDEYPNLLYFLRSIKDNPEKVWAGVGNTSGDKKNPMLISDRSLNPVKPEPKPGWLDDRKEDRGFTSGLVESINEQCGACGKTPFTGIIDGNREIENVFKTEVIDEHRKIEEELFTYIHRDYLQNFMSLKESRNRVIPFLGAGIATPFGLPTWHQLFEDLASEINRKSESRFLDFVTQGNYFDAVRYLQSNSASLVTDSQIKEEISEKLKRLLNMSISQDLHNYEELRTFNPKLYLTTNYDNSLSKYINSTALCLNDVENFQKLYNQDEHKVLHIHGIWDRPSKMVLTQNDYDALYSDINFSHRFAALMGINKLLFIGFSFKDDYFKLMYRHLSEYLGGQHYIIVPNPEFFDIQQYAKLNLKIIGVNVAKKDDGKLDNISLVKSIRGVFNCLNK